MYCVLWSGQGTTNHHQFIHGWRAGPTLRGNRSTKHRQSLPWRNATSLTLCPLDSGRKDKRASLLRHRTMVKHQWTTDGSCQEPVSFTGAPVMWVGAEVQSWAVYSPSTTAESRTGLPSVGARATSGNHWVTYHGSAQLECRKGTMDLELRALPILVTRSLSTFCVFDFFGLDYRESGALDLAGRREVHVLLQKTEQRSKQPHFTSSSAQNVRLVD